MTSTLGAVILLVVFAAGVTTLLQVQRNLEDGQMVNSFIHAPDILGSGDPDQINTVLETRFGLTSGYEFRVLDLRVSNNSSDPTIIGEAGTCLALDPELLSLGRANWAGVGINYLRGIGVCMGLGQTQISIQSKPMGISGNEAIALPGCFSGETRVLAVGEDGRAIQIPIEQIKEGMKVLSLPADGHEAAKIASNQNSFHPNDVSDLLALLAPKRVTRVFVHKNSPSGEVRLLVASGNINTTPEHPFFVIGKGWIPAGSLEVGDNVLSTGDKPLEVLGLSITPSKRELFNFTVEDFHSYFVFPDGGDEALWVHNAKVIPE